MDFGTKVKCVYPAHRNRKKMWNKGRSSQRREEPWSWQQGEEQTHEPSGNLL